MSPSRDPLSNAEIADRLLSLAQLLSTQKENLYKVRAYQRAAGQIRNIPESLDNIVRTGGDLTVFPAIGKAIASAIQEIVQTGTLGKLDTLRSTAAPEIASLSQYPRLDPARVLRIYKKLGISTVEQLREALDSGEIDRVAGPRLAQHVRQGLTESHSMLLYRADALAAAIQRFLLGPCAVRRAALAGDCRRRVEVIDEVVFLIDTDDFSGVIARLKTYGGRTPLLSSSNDEAVFALSAGVTLRIHRSTPQTWGLDWIRATGSAAHLRQLRPPTTGDFPTETDVYVHCGLQYIDPELREGQGEIDLARGHRLPVLVTRADIRGDLHAHSTSSDGSDTIEEMAEAAQARGYAYLGITDHSQSLKIARGLSVADLVQQIRFIDNLNGRLRNFRILKSAEVDILADGSLDYPDELLAELDYTVCSIHSRFGLNKREQTDRLLRAMDNRYFNILGHATGRLLLKRPGYELDFERVIEQARQNRCFFEINCSPDRLDLSAGNARLAATAGVKVAISTDSHSTGEMDLIRCGLDQARRAGLEKSSVLNTFLLEDLLQYFHR